MSEKILTQTVVIGQALIVHQDKYLLVQEKDSTWFLPAGRIENTENILDGIKREIVEEAGIIADITGVLRIYHTFFTMNGVKTGKLILIFKGVPEEISDFGHMRKSQPDSHTLQSQWFDLDEIKKLTLRSIEVLLAIDSYLDLKKNNGMLPIEHTDFLYMG